MLKLIQTIILFVSINALTYGQKAVYYRGEHQESLIKINDENPIGFPFKALFVDSITKVPYTGKIKICEEYPSFRQYNYSQTENGKIYGLYKEYAGSRQNSNIWKWSVISKMYVDSSRILIYRNYSKKSNVGYFYYRYDDGYSIKIQYFKNKILYTKYNNKKTVERKRLKSIQELYKLMCNFPMFDLMKIVGLFEPKHQEYMTQIPEDF